MHYLEIFDILPEKMLEVYDIEKSNKLIEAELSSPQQKIPTLVKALAHCPHNIRVYERLLAENADLATLKQIAVLVGIDQELEACGQKIQREQEQRRLLEQQRREEAVLAAQRRLEQQRLAQEAARKDAERARINSEICELEQELASLKGLFVGKRKKEINQEIASLREKLEAI
jgi:chromosome segregation ATPase